MFVAQPTQLLEVAGLGWVHPGGADDRFGEHGGHPARVLLEDGADRFRVIFGDLDHVRDAGPEAQLVGRQPG